MNSDLEHLIVLQAQDVDLQRLRKELADLPRRVESARKALARAQQAETAAQTSLQTEEKLRRGQESEIASLRSKMDRLRRSLEGATSATQVSAFEHEIAFASSSAGKLEDEEFASLERSEALEEEHTQARSDATRLTKTLEEETSRAARLTTEIQQSIAGIETQRRELRTQVDECWLSTYDRLSKAKGTALAEALGNATAGKCASCQMGVRPQRWQDLIGRDHEDEIFACESCGRLLFWDPRRDTPKAWEAGDRLRRATGLSATEGSR